jgi:hypothetical protein
MTVTGTMIITRGGTVLPLDQRRRDALMNYAVQAADAAGMPRQAWCRKVWKLKDYEAKDLLKGNASETVWERIIKMRGPHCGWEVALPVTAAVVGQDLHEFFREQMRAAAKEAEHAEHHERIAQAAYRRLAADPADLGPPRRTRQGAGKVGAEAPRRVAGGP